MDIQALDRWLNFRPFTLTEQKTLAHVEAIFDDYEFHEKLNGWEFNKSMYLKSIGLDNSYHVGVDAYERTLIAKLFKKYVDDDTMVITTNREHPTVENQLDLINPKRVYYIDIVKLNEDYESEVNRLSQAIRNSKYKKFFVYIIHLTNEGIYATPVIFHRALKSMLQGKSHKMVLDCAQSLYLMWADYSLFDYVLTTAHATAQPYSMGIVIKKEDDDIGIKDGYILGLYREVLNAIINRVDKMMQFWPTMRLTFADSPIQWLPCPQFRCVMDCPMPAADLGQVNSYEIPVVSPENSFHKRIAWRAPIYLFKRDTLRLACIALDNMLNMQ